MLITQYTNIMAGNLELSGGGLESGDGENYVRGIEELEDQASTKGGSTHRGRPHEARSLSKIVKNVPAVPTDILRANLISQISKSWKHPP